MTTISLAKRLYQPHESLHGVSPCECDICESFDACAMRWTGEFLCAACAAEYAGEPECTCAWHGDWSDAGSCMLCNPKSPYNVSLDERRSQGDTPLSEAESCALGIPKTHRAVQGLPYETEAA